MLREDNPHFCLLLTHTFLSNTYFSTLGNICFMLEPKISHLHQLSKDPAPINSRNSIFWLSVTKNRYLCGHLGFLQNRNYHNYICPCVIIESRCILSRQKSSLLQYKLKYMPKKKFNFAVK